MENKLLHGITLAYESELDEGLYVFGEWIQVCLFERGSTNSQGKGLGMKF